MVASTFPQNPRTRQEIFTQPFENTRMPQLPVDMSQLELALERTEGIFVFLNLETGDTVWCDTLGYTDSDGDPDEYDADDRYVSFPRIESRDSYRWMVEFIDTVQDSRLANCLDAAIQGRGAFRRFKDTLSQPELQRWYTFRQAKIDAVLQDFLQEHDIQPLPAIQRETAR